MISLKKNDNEKTRQLRAREWNCIPTSPQMQKLSKMRYYFTLTGMTIIKMIDKTSAAKDLWKLESKYTSDENVKWCSDFSLVGF